MNLTMMLFCSSRGARHGLTMSAKLARLEQQEAEFMAKYGKKSQPTSASAIFVAPVTSQSSERREETANDPQRKKMKKKRSAGNIYELNDDVSENPDTEVKPKKKKKKVSEKAEEVADAGATDEGAMGFQNGDVDHSHKTKRKHKKKKNKAEENDEERALPSALDCRTPEEMPELHTDTKVKEDKKKKKSSKRSKEESKYAESSQPEVLQDSAPKVAGEESTVKQNRKRSKKDKLSMDVNVNVDSGLNKEERPPKKRKKSKE